MKNVLIAGAIAATLTLAGCHGSAPKKPYVQAPEPEKRSALAAIATASAENKAAKKQVSNGVTLVKLSKVLKHW